MATLASARPRTFETGHDEVLNGLPIIAADIVYRGAAVGELNDSGTFRPLASADKFGGFATDTIDNAAGAASALNIPVKEVSYIVLDVTGASSAADKGKDVYATDDDTFTLTVGGSSIGTVHRWISGTQCVVRAVAFSLRPSIVVVHGGETVDLANDRAFFVAPRPFYIKSITAVFAVAAGGASALQVTKDTGTDAPGGGTNLLTDNTDVGFDLNATANTVQYGTLVTTAGVRKLAKGDRLSIDFAQAIQNTAGLKITVELVPL
jgi:hypothetical protein